jgi:hypothetical protein
MHIIWCRLLPILSFLTDLCDLLLCHIIVSDPVMNKYCSYFSMQITEERMLLNFIPFKKNTCMLSVLVAKITASTYETALCYGNHGH